MNKNVSSEYGQIKIHKRPILQVAEMSAREIKGVRKVGWECYCLLGQIAKILNILGTRVHIENNKNIKIVVPIVTIYGLNAVDIGYEVQRNIVSKIVNMLNIESLSVDVKIKRVERGAK